MAHRSTLDACGGGIIASDMEQRYQRNIVDRISDPARINQGILCSLESLYCLASNVMVLSLQIDDLLDTGEGWLYLAGVKDVLTCD